MNNLTWATLQSSYSYPPWSGTSTRPARPTFQQIQGCLTHGEPLRRNDIDFTIARAALTLSFKDFYIHAEIRRFFQRRHQLTKVFVISKVPEYSISLETLFSARSAYSSEPSPDQVERMYQAMTATWVIHEAIKLSTAAQYTDDDEDNEALAEAQSLLEESDTTHLLDIIEMHNFLCEFLVPKVTTPFAACPRKDVKVNSLHHHFGEGTGWFSGTQNKEDKFNRLMRILRSGLNTADVLGMILMSIGKIPWPADNLGWLIVQVGFGYREPNVMRRINNISDFNATSSTPIDITDTIIDRLMAHNLRADGVSENFLDIKRERQSFPIGSGWIATIRGRFFDAHDPHHRILAILQPSPLGCQQGLLCPTSLNAATDDIAEQARSRLESLRVSAISSGRVGRPEIKLRSW